MKALRKTVNNNKALFTFGLVLFFLFAGLSKSFAATKSIKFQHKKEQSSGTYMVADEDSDSRFDDLKAFDCDSDDLDFAFFGEITFTNILTPVKQTRTFSSFSGCKSIYTVPLYDLFCNWKLHLNK